MKKSILLTFAFVLTACGKTGEPPATSTSGEISVASLMADEAPAAPVSNHWFMPRAGAGPALREFSGVIRIPEHVMHARVTMIDIGDFSAIEDEFRYPAPEGSDQILPGEIAGKATQLFPGLDVAFVAAFDDNALTIMDISDPTNPMLLAIRAPTRTTRCAQ